MVSISAQDLTYRFDNGDTLFSDLTFTLDDKITGMVGRNGAGKSILAMFLASEKNSFFRFCHHFLPSGLAAPDWRG